MSPWVNSNGRSAAFDSAFRQLAAPAAPMQAVAFTHPNREEQMTSLAVDLSASGYELSQQELDDLWSAFVVTMHDPEGFACLRDEAGDHVIQSVATGEQWHRKAHSSRWANVGTGPRPWLAWLR